MRYWWVNQSRTHEQEQTGGYLWSPKTKRNGAYNQFYENMKQVTPGDLVFCYWNRALWACGIVRSACYDSPRPAEFGNAGSSWAKDGHRVDMAFRPIDPAVVPKVHFETIRPLLPEKYSPLNPATGVGLQSVYLAGMPEPLGLLLLSLVKGSDDLVKAADAQRESSEAPEIAAAIAAVEEAAGRRAPGQGFGLSAAARKAVEDQAMDVAKDHYEKEKWVVEDVSKKQSYDLVCRRGAEELHVEVKGTTGLGEKVFLPKNEVLHAKKQHPNVALFVVYGIRLTAKNPPKATGGTVRLLYPWDVDEGQLEALAFAYTVPK